MTEETGKPVDFGPDALTLPGGSIAFPQGDVEVHVFDAVNESVLRPGPRKGVRLVHKPSGIEVSRFTEDSLDLNRQRALLDLLEALANRGKTAPVAGVEALALGATIYRRPERDNAPDWAEAERIANLPVVHEALKNFAHDTTKSNGVEVVLAVLDEAFKAKGSR